MVFKYISLVFLTAATVLALDSPDADDSVVDGAVERQFAQEVVVSHKSEDKPKASGMPSFERYEVILERNPFGSLAAAVDVNAELDKTQQQRTQEEQKLARQIQMVAVNRTPAGKVAVGFIDNGAKPPRSYYLNIGQAADGYAVIDANYEEETATLNKDDIVITLKLGQGLVAASEAAPEDQQPQAAIPPRVARTAARGADAPAARTHSARGMGSESFRARLQRQRAEREAATTARQQQAALDAEARAEKITKEELEKQKREINLNLMRQGMAPISPITLTEEEDAEMVRLGVLE